MGASSRWRASSRLFATFAILSLLPVLVLGAILALQYRSEVQTRGVDQGRAQALVVARVLSETVLHEGGLADGLDAEELRHLRALTDAEVSGDHVRRLRIRDLDQTVLFADDGSGGGQGPDDEAAEALEGETIAQLTRLNSDLNDTGPAGERVVEVYAPLRDATSGTVSGVLEIYLPYAPIETALQAGLRRLYLTLGLGLGLLYVVLACLSGWTTSRLRHNADALRHLAGHDVLTDLPNRTLFAERIDEAVAGAARSGSGAAVVLLDLDRFKEVNDTLGHPNGDLLLVRLAERLRQTVRGVDTVARLGGDEFGLVLPGVGQPASVLTALARVRAAIEQEVELAGLPLSLQASIGVALVPQDGGGADELLQHADVAMYVAKRTHAGVTFYEDALNDHDSERLSLVAELRRAIERDELVLHYQPQVEQPSGAVRTVEALVRWQHPTRGLLAPDTFVPVAEQTGLIEGLTRWVLDEALGQLKSWAAIAPDLVVAVNISARSLQREDFPAMVLDALARAGESPERLLLEITETALVTDAERATKVLGRLHDAGLRLSLDDFGQGYTSLGQLSGLPLSELKIDKSFVLNMLASTGDAAIVRSVVELGHNLGMDVVAEGVETPEALELLRGLRCDITQGFLFSRPLPAEELHAWLLDHTREVAAAGR